MRNTLAARQLGELLRPRLTAGRCKYLDWSGKVQERRTCGERGAARVSYRNVARGTSPHHRRAGGGRDLSGLRSPPGAAHRDGFGDPRFAAPQAPRPGAVTAATGESSGGRPRPRSGAVPSGPRDGGQRAGGRLRDAGRLELHGRPGATPALRPDDARRVAQSSVDGPGLDLRGEDAGGPMLAEPARPAHRGGGLDSMCRRERRPNRPADHLLVAPGAGRGEPARQVPAALPATVVRGGRWRLVKVGGGWWRLWRWCVRGVTSTILDNLPNLHHPPIAPRSPCRRWGGTWPRPCRPRSR